MNGYPSKWGVCIMCGAEQGKTCTVISGTGEPGDRPGDPRAYPHGNRTQPQQIGTELDPARNGRTFVAVKDEPNHYRGQPHTAECGTDCPLPPVQADARGSAVNP